METFGIVIIVALVLAAGVFGYNKWKEKKAPPVAPPTPLPPAPVAKKTGARKNTKGVK